MPEVSEHVASSVLLTENYLDTAEGPFKKDAPIAFGSQRFTTGQMSLTMHANEFLVVLFALDEFGRNLCEVKKSTILLTDNKALTRFLQAKQNPPKLWNFSDQTLQFSFTLAHVPGTENPAAECLSRSEIETRTESGSSTQTAYQSTTST